MFYGVYTWFCGYTERESILSSTYRQVLEPFEVKWKLIICKFWVVLLGYSVLDRFRLHLNLMDASLEFFDEGAFLNSTLISAAKSSVYNIYDETHFCALRAQGSPINSTMYVIGYD